MFMSFWVYLGLIFVTVQAQNIYTSPDEMIIQMSYEINPKPK